MNVRVRQSVARGSIGGRPWLGWWQALLAPLAIVTGCYQGIQDASLDDGEQTGGPRPSADEDPAASDDDNDGPVAASCTDPTVVSSPLRRLSSVQYRNLLRDTVRIALDEPGPGDETDATLAEVSSLTSLVPEDDRPLIGSETFARTRRLAQGIELAWVESTYRVAEGIGAALTAPARVERVFGACAVDPSADVAACIDQFAERVVARAYRAPLDDAQRQFLYDAYGDLAEGASASGYAQVVTAVFSSPSFLYHMEHGDEKVAGTTDTYWLSDYELASRLSFHFWNTLPDDELWDAAEAGALATDEGFDEQLLRVATDERAESVYGTFFSEWFALEDLPSLDAAVGEPAFDAFAGEHSPSAQLRGDALAELDALTRYVTWEQGGSFGDLLKSDLSVTSSEELAALYGVEPWDGEGEPPRFADGERPGPLTRAAMLANGVVHTRPIMRGVFLRTRILCQQIPPPPDDAEMQADEAEESFDKPMTTRDKTERLTAPGQCAACHETLINPLGYALEGYDALGRARTMETILDEDGQVLDVLPVDTSTEPNLEVGDSTRVAGAQELIELIERGGHADECFAQHYVEYSMGRLLQEEDACTVDTVTHQLEDGASLLDVFVSVARTAAFRQRTIVE